MKKYRLKNLKGFSMQTIVDVVCVQEGYVLGFIRYPKCWDLKDKPFYMAEKQFNEEYVVAEGPWRKR